jgi:phosphatidylglycerol---prolipoprotein diacylglyceryl transferase
MHLFNFIIWDVSPSIGPTPIRWYGLLFALGFLLGQQILIRIYKGEGKSEKNVETLTIYMVIATIVGARLGHCLFYEPDYYLANPLEILMIWQGGLASHGAALGILIGLYIYSKKEVGQSYFYVLDRIVIVIALAAALIRTGNLMNSEIIGRPTASSWGFIFVEEPKSRILNQYEGLIEDVTFSHNEKDSWLHNLYVTGLDMKVSFNKTIADENLKEFANVRLRDAIIGHDTDYLIVPEGEIPVIISSSPKGSVATLQIYGVPRHPAQIYEALSSIILFFILLFMYSKTKGKTPEGRLFGLFVVVIFTLRFLYEFIKEAQVAFEEDLMFNMGQLLSIPLIIAGFFIFLRTFKKKNEII